jgi:hypothetical protein
MVRLDASRTARSTPRSLPVTPQADEAAATPHKGWPFAEGSQNHLDETSAPWPRPSARPSSGQPDRPSPQK